MPYTRDEVVTEVISFYEFLRTMYLPDDAIAYPPVEGWPAITASYLSFLGKSDAIVDLLRHLPYVRREATDPCYLIYKRCACNDFREADFEEAARQVEDRQVVEPPPKSITLEAYVVCLAVATPHDSE